MSTSVKSGVFLNDWYSCPSCKEIATPNGYGMSFCDAHAPKRTKNQPRQVITVGPVHTFVHNGNRHILYDDRGSGYNNFSLKISLKGKFKVITGVNNIVDYIKQLALDIEDRTIMEKILLEGSM